LRRSGHILPWFGEVILVYEFRLNRPSLAPPYGKVPEVGLSSVAVAKKYTNTGQAERWRRTLGRTLER